MKNFNKSTSVNRILLIDDNDTDNFISRKVLEIHGFQGEIIAFNSGVEGLDFLKNISETKDLPDLIFLDINMPIIDGFMFMYEYEKLSPAIRSHCQIIILSSSDNESDIERMIGNDYVDGFITKPLNSVALKEMCPALTMNAKNAEHVNYHQ